MMLDEHIGCDNNSSHQVETTETIMNTIPFQLKLISIRDEKTHAFLRYEARVIIAVDRTMDDWENMVGINDGQYACDATSATLESSPFPVANKVEFYKLMQKFCGIMLSEEAKDFTGVDSLDRIESLLMNA